MFGRAAGDKRRERRNRVTLGILAFLVLAAAGLIWSELAPSRGHLVEHAAEATATAPRTPSAPEPETPSLAAVGERLGPPIQPAVSAPPPEELPPLQESDAFVRLRAEPLSAHPGWGGWLGHEGLVETATMTVASVAEGHVPRRPLSFLRPGLPFSVVEEGEQVRVDPRSYRRYDRVAEVVSSLQVERVGPLYRAWYPLFQDAYASLGEGDDDFHARLEGAIQELLEVPVLHEPPQLVPRTRRYEYADRDLESLSDAQKQLLRMGPRNVQRIQASLRRLAAGLGLDASSDESPGVHALPHDPLPMSPLPDDEGTPTRTSAVAPAPR